MANKAKFKAIKGMRDVLPPETELWNRVEETAREVFGTYGFGEIRPPILEATELFARAVGGETDIVSKEMYSIPDPIDKYERQVRFLEEELPKLDKRGENLKQYLEEVQREFDKYPAVELISLRPEATASVCRAYIEYNMNQWPGPVKLYYTGPMFRRERPQKGRYRQFYQIGAEVLGGTDAPGIDAEVIEMVMTFLGRLGLEGVQLDINSIGHNAPNCRPKYVELLRAELLKVRDKLGADSQRRIERNPLRVLDSKLEHEQAIIATLPKIGDHFCDDCAKHYAEVKWQLDLRGVKYHENWRLVRGLDYYMRTTFEITATGLGSQNAVCGGGRYDGLVELLGGPPTKGIGFAIGEDRLILSLQEARKELAKGEGRGPSEKTGCDVYIAWMGVKAQGTAILAAQKLREAGLRVELPAIEQKFGKALTQADRLRSKYVLLLGEDEIASGQWTLKTLADGTQTRCTETELVEFLKKWRVASEARG
jgi:histidyl-tRNA synthetase